MEKIIENLNLKTLNLVNRNKIKYEERPNGVKKWSFHTTVSNTECNVEIFSHKEYIQIYIYPNIIIDSKVSWLRKINDINTKRMGCGVSCYLKSKSLVLKTHMTDFELHSDKYVLDILNIALLCVPQILHEMNS